MSRDERIIQVEWALAAKRSVLRIRSAIIRATRDFFLNRGYTEVETPIRMPAPAPEIYIDAVPSASWFLQTSPELCMKRMLAAGYDRIFQICKCFRDAERGGCHLPEFTMLEWYRSGVDYKALMDECEELILFISGIIGKGKCIEYAGTKIGLEHPWEMITVRDAFNRYAPKSAGEALESGDFDETLVKYIEPRLGVVKPTFLYDYPAPLSALARLKKDDPSVAERFELYIGGMELANGFSELTDAREQKERFIKDAEERRSMGKTVYPVPEKFLRSLADMPESSGIALGIDRLSMILTDSRIIDEVVAFTPEQL